MTRCIGYIGQIGWAALLAVLVGCGGSGGGGSPSPFGPAPLPQPGSSRPPTDTTPPTLSGVGNVAIDRGDAFDPLAGVTANDHIDGDLTGSIRFSGAVDVRLPGQYTLHYGVTDAASNTAAASRAVTVTVPAGLPDVDDETVYSGYFDIAAGSPSDSEVIGRINLERNRRAAASPVLVGSGASFARPAASPVPHTYGFAVIEDDSNGMFKLRSKRDGDGRLFGVFTVADGKTAETGHYSLRVELRQGSTVLARFSAPITVADRTQWDIYHEKMVEFVNRERRLTGGQNYEDSQVAELIGELEANGGAFKDIKFYSATTKAEWRAIGQLALSSELQRASWYIGGLGRAYSRSPTYGPAGNPMERDRLRNAIYLALIAYVDHFPLDDFANTALIDDDDGLTRQWIFTDAISGAAVLILADLIADLNNGVERAGKVRERLFRLLQINFDLPKKWRVPTNIIYYQINKLSKSAGGFADANRHHRMRSWAAMVAIWHDYNRPLTELPWWYDDYKPFASQGTSLLPEWQPSGSLADLRTWLETNARFARRYSQSGLLPDGTVSHHAYFRQDMVFWAYGFEWIAGANIKAFKLLADSNWKLSNKPYDHAADFLLFAYPKLIFKDGIDFQAVGRSHYSDRIGEFGSRVLARSIDTLLEARSADTVISRAFELNELRERMLDGSHEDSGNTAFWANDYMIHRRGGEPGEAAYFMSVKMQSARTRGAESFRNSSDYGVHNGSGVLQVKVDGDEYRDSRYKWDWHALPGVTEELRTDKLPILEASWQFNPNHFAGAASNGRHGLAAFRYASKAPYTSAAAYKGYFFVKDYALALGNGVKRVRNTDGSNKESIVTTIDQAAWDTVIVYRLNGADIDTLVMRGDDIDTSLSVTGNSWFHQDGIGYVILPLAGDIDVRLTGGGGIVVTDRETSQLCPVDVFRLAIDHGAKPDGSGAAGRYAYLLIPNVTAAAMPGVMSDIENRFEMVNTRRVVQGHRYADGALELVQLAFYSAGTATFKNGLTVTVDKPALVQLQNEGGDWNITVQDPTHGADKAAIASSSVFEHILLPGASRIAVEVNRPLRPGVYMYDTQGPDVRFVAGQTVEVADNGNGTSRITVNLPDSLDAFEYDYREEFHAGMPAVVNVPGR